MFDKYIRRKIYFDKDSTISLGLSEFGHLIIEQERGDKLNSIVLYEDCLSVLKTKLEKFLKNKDNNNSKIYDKNECGIDTKVYMSSIHDEDLHYQGDQVVISQNDYDNVTFQGTELLEILHEVKTNFKKNEGV